MRKVIILGLLALAACFPTGKQPSVPSKINNLTVVNNTTIAAAIAAAKKDFAANPNDTYTIGLPAGTFQVPGTIDVSDVHPGASGALVVQGAGSTATTLLGDGTNTGIYGRNTYQVSFTGIHFTLPNYTTTLGVVVSVVRGHVTMDIAPGFPTPLDIFDPKNPQGRYLRAYTTSATAPQIITTNNDQLPWTSVVQVAGNRWDFVLKGSKIAPYAVGMLVGVKSKEARNVIELCGGSQFTLKDILMTERSRAVFRCGFDHVLIDGLVVTRDAPINGQVSALSTAAGGPQIGQPGDPRTDYNVVTNSNFEATGDDSVAMFNNGPHSMVTNSTISDSFARGILFFHSPKAQATGDTLNRDVIQR